MTRITLRHRDILRGSAAVHITRAQLTSTRPKSLHGHDFFELFWVQNGQVRHHLPNGITTLTEGCIGFIRPADTHGLQGRGDDALIVSLTLDPNLIYALSLRHEDLRGQFFWADAPQMRQLDLQAMLALNQAALTLEQGPRDALATEAFLLPLFAKLTRPKQTSAPSWLLDAATKAQSPKVFRQGAAGLVALTGQTHPHVSRTMKALMGISPSAFINDLRMAHAARALSGTSDTLNDIAADIGIPNLSHFHKTFRAAYGMTPHQYRSKFQRDVVQPTHD